MNSLGVTASKIENATKYDPVLSKVLHNVRHGWPDTFPDSLKLYYNRRHELTIEANCILWGIRVVIPVKLHRQILDELHESHFGIFKMKMIARSHVWWPGIDKGIANMAKGCKACLALQHSPAPAPLHPWAWPICNTPWEGVHVDFGCLF